MLTCFYSEHKISDEGLLDCLNCNDEFMSQNVIYLEDYANFTANIASFTITIITMENKSFNRIKVVLVENQKTSRWLAEQLGKSDTTVSRWVSNKIQPSVEQLFEIAAILKVDVRTLLKANEKITSE